MIKTAVRRSLSNRAAALQGAQGNKEKRNSKKIHLRGEIITKGKASLLSLPIPFCHSPRASAAVPLPIHSPLPQASPPTLGKLFGIFLPTTAFFKASNQKNRLETKHSVVHISHQLPQKGLYAVASCLPIGDTKALATPRVRPTSFREPWVSPSLPWVTNSIAA